MFDSPLAAHKPSIPSMKLYLPAIALATLYMQVSAAPATNGASKVSLHHRELRL